MQLHTYSTYEHVAQPMHCTQIRNSSAPESGLEIICSNAATPNAMRNLLRLQKHAV